MWPHALATARFALRSPMSYGLVALGAFLAWFGISLAILALDVNANDHARVVAATAELAAVVLVVWLVQRTLDDDAGSGFTAATDAAGPGVAGRLVGRWAGSVLAGVVLALAVRATVASVSGLPAASLLYLLITSICSIALLGAWAVVLGAGGRGGLLPALALGAWVAGHLPWGQSGWMPGPVGRALSAWLPGPFDAGEPREIAVRLTVVIALLLLAVGLARPERRSDG